MGKQAAAGSKKRDSRKAVARGLSSVGRAPALQAGGREFESLSLHLRMKHSQNRNKYIKEDIIQIVTI